MLAADLLIDAGLRRIDTSMFGVFNRIVEGRINAAVLITGSSRAVNHYDPRPITKRTGQSAWNIGINGSQTDMQLAVLRTYLKRNIAPQLVIHNLDSFAFDTSKSGIAFSEAYLPYLNEPSIYETLRHVDSNWWKAKYLPLYGYAVEDMRFGWVGGLGALLGWQPTETRFNGFEPRALSWTQDFEHFRRVNPNGVRFPVEAEGVRALEDMLDLLAQRNIRVVLVYSPVYYEMQDLERGREELFAKFSKIAAHYHALLWDYSGSPLSRRREFFYNSQHLNTDGAAAFSNELADRLQASGVLHHRRVAGN